jgi:integrase
MFVRWCSQVRDCDLTAPANLDSREFGFREPDGTGRRRQQKKAMLWSVLEFNTAISVLPAPYPAFLMLMLNCGFRHVDLSELRKSDIDLKKGRLTIQRNKLNQQDTAPVVSYPLWKKTIELVSASMSADPVFVFTNERGNQVELSIKLWWKRYAEKHGFGIKRLDYIRKTGSTTIARIDTRLDTMYLGETLDTTAKIHYSFNDGEPCQALDDAIGEMGAQFGFCESPVRRVALTPEVLAKLSAAGIDLSSL